MFTIDDYIARAIIRAGLSSDRELARTLDLSHMSISNWRTRRTWPSDETMIRLAELAGLDAKVALIELNTWRAKSPSVRDLYAELRQALPSLITAAFMTAALLAPTPVRAENRLARALPDLYIMRLSRRLRRAVSRYLNTSIDVADYPPPRLIPVEPRGLPCR